MRRHPQVRASDNVPTTARLATSSLMSDPENSQLAIRYRPSAEKSMWSTPRQGTGTESTSAIVVGFRKSRRWIALGDDNGVFAIGRVVHVVRVLDANGLAFLSRRRIDFRQAIAQIAQNPECLQIVRRRDMLRLSSDLEVIHDPKGLRIDHVHGVAVAIGDVNQIGGSSSPWD